MVRGRNPFWNYAEELNSKPERFRCKFCELDFSGAIPRIKSHLSGIKGRGIVACKKVSDQVRQQAKLAIENPGNIRLLADSELENTSKRARTTDTSTDAEDRERSEGSSQHFSRGLHGNFTPETLEKDNSMVDEKLAKFLVSNNIGFDVVEAPSFADFVRYVAEFGVEYKLPSSSVLHRKFLPQVLSEAEKYISNVRGSWKKTGCTIMLDSCHNFINIMAYSLEGAIFMRSVEVSKRQSVDIIEDILPSIIEEIGIDHVVQFITNDAAIFHYVESMLPSKYPKMFVVRCVAHEIHYLLEETSSEFLWIEEVIQDAKLIVSFIYTHDNVSSLMRQYTNNKELKYPCKSTFASNYQMLKSLFDNRNELEQLVASDSWCLLNFEKKEAIADIIKGNEFWDPIRQVLNFMEQFVRVLRLVEDDRCTSGYLYEEMKTAKQATRSFSIDSEKVIQMVEMRSERIIHPIHAAAAFLNPAIMSRVNFEEDDEMKQGIEFMLNTLVGAEEKNSFMEEVQLYRRKVSKLFTSVGHKMLETSHPSIWWDYCGKHLPVLRKYAIRVLSQPCKCSFGLQYCARKVSQVMKVNGITPSSQDSLIYKKINAMIMEKFRILEEKLPLPITLADCNENTDYVQYCGGGLAELIDEAPGNRGVGETDPLSKSCNDQVMAKAALATPSHQIHMPLATRVTFISVTSDEALPQQETPSTLDLIQSVSKNSESSVRERTHIVQRGSHDDQRAKDGNSDPIGGADYGICLDGIGGDCLEELSHYLNSNSIKTPELYSKNRNLPRTNLTTYLSSLNVSDQNEHGTVDSGTKVVQTISERTATPLSYGDAPDALSMKDSLTAVCNATQPASRIYQVFRMQSFQRKKLDDSGDGSFGVSDEHALSIVAAKAWNSTGIANAAATQIQKKFRGWKKRKEFLIIRQRIGKVCVVFYFCSFFLWTFRFLLSLYLLTL